MSVLGLKCRTVSKCGSRWRATCVWWLWRYRFLWWWTWRWETLKIRSCKTNRANISGWDLRPTLWWWLLWCGVLFLTLSVSNRHMVLHLVPIWTNEAEMVDGGRHHVVLEHFKWDHQHRRPFHSGLIRFWKFEHTGWWWRTKLTWASFQHSRPLPNPHHAFYSFRTRVLGHVAASCVTFEGNHDGDDLVHSSRPHGSHRGLTNGPCHLYRVKHFARYMGRDAIANTPQGVSDATRPIARRGRGWPTRLNSSDLEGPFFDSIALTGPGWWTNRSGQHTSDLIR